MNNDAPADFLRCRAVLQGDRPPLSAASRKTIRIVTSMHGDVSLSPTGFRFRQQSGHDNRYFSSLGPPMLAHLLDAGKLSDPIDSAAFSVTAEETTHAYRRFAATVWVRLAPTEIILRVRAVPGPQAPLVPIPTAGTWCIPAAIGPWKPAPKVYRDNAVVRCPCCGEIPARLRRISGRRVVCGGCARSFAG